MTNKKKNMIILWGSDGAGKTTIANSISGLTTYPVKHFGPAKGLEEGKNEYFSFIHENNKSIILDRFYEGERIYAPLYRGYTADYFRYLEKCIMKKYNVMLVLVYAPFSVIEQRLQERGEDFVKKEHLKHCYESVTREFNESILPKMIIDTTDKEPIVNAAIIIDNLLQKYS